MNPGDCPAVNVLTKYDLFNELQFDLPEVPEAPKQVKKP